MNQNNRPLFLVTTTVVLLLFAIVYHIWANWGLVTIHARNEPLSKVIASMQRQGHAKVETDMPGDTQVTMDCDKVPLPDALETLATVTDSRWRLLYFVAGDKTTVKMGEDAWFGGQPPSDWKMVSFPMGTNMIPVSDVDDIEPPDPRYDQWTPKTAAGAPVQDFFKEAAQVTNAGFAFPAAWNPTVSSAPAPGVVNHVVPKLVSAAHGREDQLFFLSKNEHRGPRGEGGGGDFSFDRDMLEIKVQNEINRLPPEQKAEAQTNFNTERAFWKSLRDMAPEQRQAAFQAHMQDPVFQQMMINRMDAREGRMSHNQRISKFANYAARKAGIIGHL